jgi:hypothetical protein
VEAEAVTNGRPSRVDNVEAYWGKLPPTPSARCSWWMDRIRAGWRPNRRISGMGYYEASEWYGVYIEEYLSVIAPSLIEDLRPLVNARAPAQ